jgi:CRISPR/Cas system-associated exonuclease Cas4 (RecB family)
MAPRKSSTFDPNSPSPFRLSRSKIDLYMKCQRCFYLDRRHGIGQPSGPPFSLNIAVDDLLKKEFDRYREIQKPHPLMTENGIDAVPFQHQDLEVWRESLRKGVSAPLAGTTLLITGGVDDVWVNRKGQLIVVDYKATSKNEEVNLDADWQIAYKRQVEIYQWLFRQNGFDVCNTAYFVYCNGDKSGDAFNARLDFTIKVLPYDGSTDWIEPALRELHQCLCSEAMPQAADGCPHCKYRERAAAVESWS